jgi:hypothetical protein
MINELCCCLDMCVFGGGGWLLVVCVSVKPH